MKTNRGNERIQLHKTGRERRKAPRARRTGGVFLALAALFLAVVMAGYSILQYVEPMTAMAKESFSGIGRIVEEHDEDDPYVILDIVPSQAYYTVQTIESTGNGETGTVTASTQYSFSTGTLGYLSGNQTTLAEELGKVIVGEGLSDYSDREELYKRVVSQSARESFPEITYEEAYGGVTSVSASDGWVLLWDTVSEGSANTQSVTGTASASAASGGTSVTVAEAGSEGTSVILAEADSEGGSEGGSTTDSGETEEGASEEGDSEEDTTTTYAQGIFTGSYVKLADGSTNTAGYDFDKISGDANSGSYTTYSTLSSAESWQYASGGNYHVTFAPAGEQTEGTALYVVDSVKAYDEGSYSTSTGLYLLEADGTYRYAGTVNQVLYGVPETEEDETDGSEEAGSTDGTESDGDEEEAGSTDGTESDGDEEEAGAAGGTESDGDGEESGAAGGTGSNGEGGESGAAGSGGTAGGSADNGSNSGDSGSGGNSSAGGSARAAGLAGQWRRLVESGTDSGEAAGSQAASGVQYYVVTFRAASEDEDSEEIFYRSEKETKITDKEDVPRPYDAYELAGEETEEEGQEAGGVSALSLEAYEAEEEEGETTNIDAYFLYVGAGKGNYKLTASGSTGTGTVASSGTTEIQVSALAEGNGNESGSGTLAVYNAPVYCRCSGGNDWLKEYVFSSLSGGDNESSSFEIEVETVRAEKVTYAMLQSADLVYLESGAFTVLNEENLSFNYIQASNDDVLDMSDSNAGELLRRAAEELLPVIVDYKAVTSDDYEDTNYQMLARAFLKKDLAGFYAEMNIQGSLMENLAMNVDSTEDFPNLKDNDYHYVNKNVYLVHADTPLVSEDFADSFEEDETERGFSAVLEAIEAENTTLSEEDQISLSVSKAMAVQYIINYAEGLIGEFGDLTILELQPTANTASDLYTVEDTKGNTKLCWQTESMSAGRQILSSETSFAVSVSVKSAAQFNGEWEDLNSVYDLVFIGLDGQRLNLSGDQYQSPVYNKEELNGKYYHTGDESGVGSYDANDITAQKMTDLLEYMEAGYPVLVEDGFFTGGSARKVSEEDINTKYIDEDSVMFRFLSSAVTDERYQECIYTVSDAMSSAMFMTRLKISRPRIALQEDGGESAGVQRVSQDTQEEYHGTIAYEIKDNRGEDYYGETLLHLYADFNYDGIFAADEELSDYTVQDNVVDLSLTDMGYGILPWKLEVTDAGNPYRRDSVQGYFEWSSPSAEEIQVLQIADGDDVWRNLQAMYEDEESSVLAAYLAGVEGITGISLEIETVTSAELGAYLETNASWLNQWDVVVWTLDQAETDGTVAEAVADYAGEGRSLLICSQDADGRMGLDAGLLGQTEENRTYVSLGADGASGYLLRYAGLEQSMFEAQTDLACQQVNEGSIAYYPYQLGSGDLTCGADTALRASEYLLDFEDNLKSETGVDYVTVWYTLGGSTSTAYGISPKDARNNYYCYSKGNVMYLGQSEYPYAYDAQEGELPEDSDGAAECKLFVNALMAAYHAGIHSPDVAIVAGFAEDSARIQSISVPFDQLWYEASDDTAGVLDTTVDVYFRYTDSNIAAQKDTQVSFYYEDPAGGVSLEGVFGEAVTATQFTSQIWTVEDNSLTLVGEEDLQAGRVYRIQAPVTALKENGTLNCADIYIVVETEFSRGGGSREVSGGASVSLNRAQLFLLE